MRSVTFKSVWEDILGDIGRDPSQATMTAAEKLQVVSLVNDRLREFCTYDFWPELMVCEERAFRTGWKHGVTYNAGQERYYPLDDKYYVALMDNTNVDPGTNDAVWQEVSDLDMYLPWTPYDAYPLGEVQIIASKDPVRYQDYVEYSFVPTDKGLSLIDCTATKVWVYFRMRPPKMTLVEFDATATYEQGDLVYQPDDGEVYQAMVDEDKFSADCGEFC